MHGTTMIFLVIVPFWAGLGNYLVPLMIGARDMAFPRLNALSYWLFLFGGIILYSSWFAKGGAPPAGWTSYVPLSEPPTRPGTGSTSGSSRCTCSRSPRSRARSTSSSRSTACGRPGMTWMRMPLFVWSMEVYAALLVAVLPMLSAGLTLLLLDRQAGTHFFLPAQGGNAILYQHVFWFFGHPEVYIMILPGFGVISEVIPVFARKPIFGYTAIALSSVAIGFYSMLVWAHHMFTVGLPGYLQGFFMISSMIIAVPTGIKIFNWLATTWRGNIHFDTPMLFALGFIARLHDRRPLGDLRRRLPVRLAGDRTRTSSSRTCTTCSSAARCSRSSPALTYWWPKIFGRMLDERLGKITFWLIFVGMNLTFFPMHMLGLLGMPRRIYTYSYGGIWEWYNLISTIGSGVMALGMLMFFVNVREDVPLGRAGGERPVAGGHARVVHDLAAAAAQLRQRSLRLEPAAAARPAAPAGGEPCLTFAPEPGCA